MRTNQREELQALLKAGQVTLVEALPESHFAAGTCRAQSTINHDQIDELAPTLLPDKVALIVTYCSNSACRNSSLAAERLERLGYTNGAKYAGATEDWAEAGLPLEAAVAA